MTFEEFGRLGMAIKEFYPHVKVLQSEQAIELWYQQLKDLDYKMTSIALSKWVGTNKWPPTVADMREMCASLVSGDAPLWSDGWQEVLSAIRNYGYMREGEALAGMTEITRETVKRLSWQALCMSEEISVERANFRKVYEQLLERKKNDEQIAPTVRKVIAEIQKNNKIGIEVDR